MGVGRDDDDLEVLSLEDMVDHGLTDDGEGGRASAEDHDGLDVVSHVDGGGGVGFEFDGVSRRVVAGVGACVN